MSGSNLDIRRAGIDDLDAVAELFDLYRRFYDQVPDLARCRRFVEKRITRSESIVFVAYPPGGGPAMGFTQLYPTFCSVAATRIFVLYDLYVSSDARRRGVGRALMKHAEDHARAAGAGRIQLETHRANRNAQRLYESLGYRREEDFFTYTLPL